MTQDKKQIVPNSQRGTNDRIHACIDLVERTSQRVISQLPDGYDVKIIGSNLYPVYRFEKGQDLVGVIRNCGATHGLEADITDLTDTVGKLIDDSLRSERIACKRRTEKYAFYQRENMY